jgi:hypothetical protein
MGLSVKMAYDKRMDSLPLFISFPRTGAHWINCVMELYFDRPRLREGRVTFLNPNRTDWMWFHDHDLDLQIRHNNVLYLYRDPIGTVHSNLVYDFFARRRLRFSWLIKFHKLNIFTESKIIEISKLYRQHLTKWILSDQRARTVVCHDSFIKNRNAEFRKICEHFNVEFDLNRASGAFNPVTKEALAKKTKNNFTIGKHMLKKSYKISLSEFSHEWGDFVREIIRTKELENLPW